MTGQAASHIEKLRAMEGQTRQEAARALDLCDAYVAKLAKDAGIALASTRQKRSSARLDLLKSLAASGFTRSQAAAEIGMSLLTINQLARKHDLKFLRGGLAAPSIRSRQMAALFKGGKTLQEIGDQFGVTRERVRQIIHKLHGLRGRDGGKTKAAARNRVKREASRNARCLKKWGCSYEQYSELKAMKKPTRAYAAQRRNALFHRGIAWEINLWQWWCIWQQSGKWELRGRGQGYVMCRKGDAGPYAVDNVFIATARENSSEQKRKKSGLPIGVAKKGAGYTAKRSINGKMYHLGTHPTPELAHAAYLDGEGAAQ